jgi:hypothetical protein
MVSSECIQVLVDYGIKVEQFTDNDNSILAGATPLHLAAYYGRVEAAQKLIACGADVNTKDFISGKTPLHIAVVQGNSSIISVLRSAKADLSITDSDGNTAATYCRSAEIKELLINPALEVLMKFAKGGFSKEEQTKALGIIEKGCGIIGCLSPAQALNLWGVDGSTPLMQGNQPFLHWKTKLMISS